MNDLILFKKECLHRKKNSLKRDLMMGLIYPFCFALQGICVYQGASFITLIAIGSLVTSAIFYLICTLLEYDDYRLDKKSLDYLEIIDIQNQKFQENKFAVPVKESEKAI